MEVYKLDTIRKLEPNTSPRDLPRTRVRCTRTPAGLVCGPGAGVEKTVVSHEVLPQAAREGPVRTHPCHADLRGISVGTPSAARSNIVTPLLVTSVRVAPSGRRFIPFRWGFYGSKT